MSQIRSAFGHWRLTVERKTTNYTITPADFGKVFTNRGATAAVTFTLPPPRPEFAGCWVEVFVEADQNVTVASGTPDTLVVFNDSAADSIAFSTAAERIGAGATFVCNDNGTRWLCFVNLGSETQTPTIAT